MCYPMLATLAVTFVVTFMTTFSAIACMLRFHGPRCPRPALTPTRLAGIGRLRGW